MMPAFTATYGVHNFNNVCISAVLNRIVRGRYTGSGTSVWCSSSDKGVTLIKDDALYINLAKLAQLKDLTDGWDGYDAMAVEEASIKNTQMLLPHLRIQPALFPTCRGTVQIEYEKEDTDYLEFEISPTSVHMLHVYPDGNTVVREWMYCEEALEEIALEVGDFYG